MIKIILLLLILYHDSFAKDIKPAFIMETSGLVSDFVIDGDKLYVGTDEGTVDIFSLREKKLINQIFIKPIQIGVYSSSQESDLQLFDVKSGRKMDKLIGHKAVPSTIRFFSEIGFFSAGYENKIFYWHLEE